MALKNPFKLEKLTLTAYKNIERTAQVGRPFKAMFNPESFKQKYSIEFAKEQGINSTGKEVKYSYSLPSELLLELLLDGTGCHENATQAMSSSLLDPDKTVDDKIKHLLDISYKMNGDIHEPNYLKVSWGSLNFSCRLKSIDIHYLSFSPDGKALRAQLSINLLSDQEVKKQLSIDGKKSPDLTHSRIVKNGDTLPLLSKQVYGSSDHYKWLAEQNKLDDFRNLTAGMVLYFPPLTSS